MAESANEPDLTNWHPRETAPSVMVKDEPTIARTLGLFGVMMVVLGTLLFIMHMSNRFQWAGPGRITFFVFVGFVCLLFHAAWDKDEQIRRIYGAFGVLWVASGCVLCLLSGKNGILTYSHYGYITWLLGLLFLLGFLRHETDDMW